MKNGTRKNGEAKNVAATSKDFVGRFKPLTPEQVKKIDELVLKGVNWSKISKRLSISSARIDRYYRKIEPKKTKRVLRNGVNSTALRLKDALYDPARDGTVYHKDLTARIMGDPPPGRREMLQLHFEKQYQLEDEDIGESGYG